MNEVNRYIDGIFRKIVHSKETKKLQGQIKNSAREKYDALVLEGTDKNDAAQRVISEIGTLEDLKKEYPTRSRALDIVACAFAVLMVISLIYTVYFFKNIDYFKKQYCIMPSIVQYYYLKPFNFLSATYIVLWIINRVSLKANQLTIRKRFVRILVLVISLCIIAFYYFNCAMAMFTDLITLSYAIMFIMKISYIFIPIGALLFWGIKKR